MYVYDNTKLWFYDKPPFRSGLLPRGLRLLLHPFDRVRPPVIFVKTDKFCASI